MSIFTDGVALAPLPTSGALLHAGSDYLTQNAAGDKILLYGTPDVQENHARILHSGNWLSGGTALASSTDAAYFADAPLNSLTYEKWKPTAVAGWWEYNHAGDGLCNCCAIAGHDLGTQACDIEVQYWDGTGWVDAVSTVSVTDDSPIMFLFNPRAAPRWRLRIVTGGLPAIAVIRFGLALTMPRPLYGGHAPLDFARQTELRSNWSETGQALGRTRQRSFLTSEFAWSNITAAWIRANMAALQKGIEAEPFFIAWRPATFGEVGYCQTDQSPVPRNAGIRDLMEFTLAVRGLGFD